VAGNSGSPASPFRRRAGLIAILVQPIIASSWLELLTVPPALRAVTALLAWASVAFSATVCIDSIVALGLVYSLSPSDAVLFTAFASAVLTMVAVPKITARSWQHSGDSETPAAVATNGLLWSMLLFLIAASLFVVMLVYPQLLAFSVQNSVPLPLLWLTVVTLLSCLFASFFLPTTIGSLWRELNSASTYLRRSHRQLLAAAVVAMALVATVSSVVVTWQITRPSGKGGGGTDYTVTVRRVPGTSDLFEITPTIEVYPGQGTSTEVFTAKLDDKQIGSTLGPGYLARSAVIPGPARYDQRTVQSPSGRPVRLPHCGPGCESFDVRFLDFPKGSIWQVEYGQLTRQPFGDTEAVTAHVELHGTGQTDVAFSYISEPWNSLPSSILDLLTTGTSIPQLVILTLLAFVVAGSPSLILALQSWIGQRLRETLAARHRRLHSGAVPATSGTSPIEQGTQAGIVSTRIDNANGEVQWLSSEEAAAYLKTTLTSVNLWCSRHDLNFDLTPDGIRRFERQELDQLLRMQSTDLTFPAGMFGSHDHQVQRFIVAIAQHDERWWRSVELRFRLAQQHPQWGGAIEAIADAIEGQLWIPAMAATEAAFQLAILDADLDAELVHRVGEAARHALSALVAQSHLSQETTALLYSSFEAVVPIAHLGAPSGDGSQLTSEAEEK